MNSLKPRQLGKVVAIASIATAFSSLGLFKAEAFTVTQKGFLIPNGANLVTANFDLNAHPPGWAQQAIALVSGQPILIFAPLGFQEQHGTTGNGLVSGRWGRQDDVWGLLWEISATISPGDNPDRPVVSFTTTVTFSKQNDQNFVPQTLYVFASSEEVREPSNIPEPSTILGMGVILGAIPVLKKEYAKRNKKKDKDA